MEHKKWVDIIKIIHTKNRDTIFKENFVFYRDIGEGRTNIYEKSLIPYEITEKHTFIFLTSVAKHAFSENYFRFDEKVNTYFFDKRINFMQHTNQLENIGHLNDTLGVKYYFKINKGVSKIDSTEMNDIFKNEKNAFLGNIDKKEWVLKEK